MARPPVGVVFPAHADVAELPAFARRAEAAGYDALWVVEDCFLAGGLTAAATALAVTEHLRVGVGLMPALMRNPALAAMEIATLGRLHPGRFAAALGHGVAAWMEQIGIGTNRRLTALREVTDAVRALLDGEEVDVHGARVSLAGVQLEHPPDRRPRLLIGTTGPKGFAVGAEAADGILLPEGCGPAFVAEAVGQTRALAGRAGRPEPGAAVYTWARLEADPERLHAAARPRIEHWLDGGHYPGPVRAAGGEDRIRDPASLPALVEELVVGGDARACARGIERRLRAGASEVALAPIGGDAMDQIEVLGAEVLPLVEVPAAPS